MSVEDKIQDVVEKGLVNPEEFGFINSLIKRFKADISKKEKLVHQTMGEINQLKINLEIIREMALNLIAAQERAEARIETAAKLREDRAKAQQDKLKLSDRKDSEDD